METWLTENNNIVGQQYVGLWFKVKISISYNNKFHKTVGLIPGKPCLKPLDKLCRPGWSKGLLHSIHSPLETGGFYIAFSYRVGAHSRVFKISLFITSCCIHKLGTDSVPSWYLYSCAFSVLVTFYFWWHFSPNISSVLVPFKFCWYFSFGDI